jgi:O-antigen ligase
VCSFLMHVAIIFGYIVIALSFESSLSIATLASGFSLVVLATAMPIGFGGWGVREASAAGVFAFYGLPVDIGVFSALIYGLVHLAVLGVNSLWAVSKTRRKPNDRQLPMMSHLASDYYWKTGLIAFVALLPFQLRVPTLSSSITLNLADPMAFLLGGSLVAFLHARGLLGSLWRRNSMWFGLGSFCLMIVYGWTVGHIRFGSNEWATANRLLGLIAIFSYLFAGASLACFADSVFIRRWSLIGSMVLVLTGWVQLLTSQSFAEFGMSYFNWLGMLSGFYQDRNAFSFICVLFLAIILLPSDPKISSKLEPFRVTVLIAGCLIFLIIYSGSRSGWGGLVVVVLFALFGNRRIVLNSVSLGVLLLVLSFAVSLIDGETISDPYSVKVLGARTEEGKLLGGLRESTWLWGGKLFSESPVFGTGLGCTLERGAPQVLHNAPLWAMAEMGLVGLALLLVLPFVVLKEILRNGWRGMNEQTRQLLCFAILWGGYSLVQDIVYQRVMWFFLGLLMCRNAITANPASATGLCPKSDTSS